MWDVLVNWLNQNLGAAQTIATMALVLFAAWQGILAHRARNDTTRLAQAAKIQADASVRMADEMREQRYDRYRPIVIVEVCGWGRASDGYMQIDANLSNVGNGSAMNLSLHLKLGDLELLPYPQIREAEWAGDDVINDAEYRSSPLRSDEVMTLDSGQKKTFGFWVGNARELGRIPFDASGAFSASYTDVFHRQFRSLLPVEMLRDRVRCSVCSLTERVESVHDS